MRESFGSAVRKRSSARQLAGETGQTLVLAVRVASLDYEVLAIDVAERAQPLPEGAVECIRARPRREEADASPGG